MIGNPDSNKLRELTVNPMGFLFYVVFNQISGNVLCFHVRHLLLVVLAVFLNEVLHQMSEHRI